MNASSNNAPRLSETRCSLCGDPRGETVVRGKDWSGQSPWDYRVVRCASCGTWRLSPGPDPADIGDIYPAEYEAYNRRSAAPEVVIPGLTHRMRRRFVDWASRGRESIWTMPASMAPGVLAARLFSRTGFGAFNPLAFHGEGRKVLDVGCATGDLMDLFLGHGWTPVGIDISERAVRLAQDKGRNAVTGRFPEDAALLAPWRPYYAVVMSNVLEHLADPLGSLRTAHQLMEPGGFLLIWTPVIDGWIQRRMTPYWYNLDIPRHLHIFSRDGLAALVRQSGFDVLSVRPQTSARAMMRTFARLARSRGREKTARFLENSTVLQRMAGPITWAADLLNAGDVVVVLARKP